MVKVYNDLDPAVGLQVNHRILIVGLNSGIFGADLGGGGPISRHAG